MTDPRAQDQPRSVPSPALPPPPPPLPTEAATLGEIYSAQLDYVWRLARRLGARPADLEDLTHDVFLVVHRRLDQYDSSRPIRPWLAGITWRILSEHRRKASHRREQAVAEMDLYPAAGDGEADLAREQARGLLLAGLDRLSNDQRDTFVLHDIEGHTAPQIAKIVGVPLNTLYSRIRLARKNLAQAVRVLRGEA